MSLGHTVYVFLDNLGAAIKLRLKSLGRGLWWLAKGLILRPLRLILWPLGLLVRGLSQISHSSGLRHVLAWLAVFSENLAITGWKFFSFQAVSLAFLLSGWQEILPPVLQMAGLAGWAVTSLVAGWRMLRCLKWPDNQAIFRRLERDTGLRHRPLQSQHDRVTADDALSAALWALHQQQEKTRIRKLRLRWPNAHLHRRDAMALRWLALLLLIVAASQGAGVWHHRRADIIAPLKNLLARIEGPTLTLWIDAPAYTPLQPVIPAANQTSPLAVLEGSIITARLPSGKLRPKLVLDDTTLAFNALPSGGWELTAPVTATTTHMKVKRWLRRSQGWQLNVAKDTAPVLAWRDMPTPAQNGEVLFHLRGTDDFGITGARLHIRPLKSDTSETDSNHTEAQDTILDLPVPAKGLDRIEWQQNLDLAASRWAGQDVSVWVTAEDAAGNSARSDSRNMYLPERDFRHPVAAEIAAQRKVLIMEPRRARLSVAQGLETLLNSPDAYDNDTVITLGLSVASSRLALAENVSPNESAATDDMLDLLWQMALQLEDGAVHSTKKSLRDAARDLQSKLDDPNASDAEINEAMEKYEQAMRDHMAALTQQALDQMRRNGENPPEIPPQALQGVLDQTDLRQMLDQMKDMAQNGSRDAAREMLDQMQSMMDGSQMADPRAMEQLEQGMNQLQAMQDIIRRQQELLDSTFAERQKRSGAETDATEPPLASPPLAQEDRLPSPDDLPAPLPMPGQQQQQEQGQGQGQDKTPPSTAQKPDNQSDFGQKQAQNQQGVRRDLGDSMAELGESLDGDLPPELGEAEQAMRRAEDALKRDDLDGAQAAQREALEALQKGRDKAGQQMADRLRGQNGKGGSRMSGLMLLPIPGMPQGGKGRDPLGRKQDPYGWLNQERIEIPDEKDRKRVREILDELRRRSGDFTRPDEERSYIERLMKRF